MLQQHCHIGQACAVTCRPWRHHRYADRGELLTIDQLADAQRASRVRNIRFYAGRGLLPPPQLRGRTGLYGPDHLARLELVSELSALGFTLSAIESHLERLPPHAGRAELALQRALLTPWVPEQIEEVDRAELERRAGRALSADELDALRRPRASVTPLPDGRRPAARRRPAQQRARRDRLRAARPTCGAAPTS